MSHPKDSPRNFPTLLQLMFKGIIDSEMCSQSRAPRRCFSPFVISTCPSYEQKDDFQLSSEQLNYLANPIPPALASRASKSDLWPHHILKVCVPLRCSPVSLCSYSLSLLSCLTFSPTSNLCYLFVLYLSVQTFFITLSRTKYVPDRKKDKSLWASFSLPLKWQIQARWSLIYDLVKTLNS